MTKPTILMILFIGFFNMDAAHATDLCWKFEPRESKSQIKNLLLRASDDAQKLVWDLKATSTDGHVFRGQVPCVKTDQATEWTCSRDDGGGSFTVLKTGEAARFSTTHFEFGDIGEKENLSLTANDFEPWIFTGEVKSCPKPLLNSPPL